ncbi:MAG: SiaB family protein kinase [Bacteroidales bacterium]|nr:SiaB family protein kinase [Bacteroidales bacterium]
MTPEERNKELNLAYQLIKDMQHDNFEYSYRGLFTQNITTKILSLAESKLIKSEDTKKIRKRIYFILVESLQNITRHQNKDENNKPVDSGIFILQKKQNKYYITTGNLINTKNIDDLTTQLEKVNSLDPDALKEFYNEMMVSGEISDKGGAGLGLIAMGRKSGNKLTYKFNKIDNNKAYFYLRTEIPLIKDLVDNNEFDYSLEDTIELHNMLNKNNILLNFNGAFNQENFVNLLSMIGGQMTGEINLREKVLFVMVEMLENLVYYSKKYATDTNAELEGSPGIFFLRYKNKEYHMTTGNYIINEEVELLQGKINKVNLLNQEELFNLYKETLLLFKTDIPKKPDLTIIEMRLKSENKLLFDFNKVDEKISFFTIQTIIK